MRYLISLLVPLADGGTTAFVFGQADPRGTDICAARVSVCHVELRSRLRLFPDATAPLGNLDAELGCTTAAPADPTPAEIPAERAPGTRKRRAMQAR